jgi:hypothetical protein
LSEAEDTYLRLLSSEFPQHLRRVIPTPIIHEEELIRHTD